MTGLGNIIFTLIGLCNFSFLQTRRDSSQCHALYSEGAGFFRRGGNPLPDQASTAPAPLQPGYCRPGLHPQR